MDISSPAVAFDRNLALRQKARELETAFLSEMLSHAGLDSAKGGFAGGIGEEQLASFLRHSQAEAMVEKGGIGLAELIFQSLARAEGKADE